MFVLQKNLLRKKRRGPLQKYQVGVPMERVSLDISGHRPVSQKGHMYILVAIDHLTKWAEAWPFPDQEAQTMARVLGEQFVTKFRSVQIRAETLNPN